MLWKKPEWFWKNSFMAISVVMSLEIFGCGSIFPMEPTVVETEREVKLSQSEKEEDREEETDKTSEICLELFQKAAEENKLDDLERIRDIVNAFGENGYSAVDSRNQIDMVRAREAARFCQMAERGEEGEITIIVVTDGGELIQYNLQVESGALDVERIYYKYEKGTMKKKATGNYQARHWKYTKEGYLMFDGSWFSEEAYVLMFGEAEEYMALRILPLDEKYRELNRKYLLPISYERNNMFLVNWNEEDFGELNFYDLFDIIYPKVKGGSLPYLPDENLGVGAVYQIPEDEFESVLMPYFNIDSEVLQQKTVYDAETGTYEYKPRGFYEIEYPEYPFPEVVGVSENSDGTVTLEVNVVYPYAGDSKFYTHEVVVRPLEDGGVQYVSNRIIPSEDNGEENWHIPRLTEEEWEKIYMMIKVAGTY